MEINPDTLPTIIELQEKFEQLNLNTKTQLEGLLWANPITYWDYIQTDALLSLQSQRTLLPDEMVFIMYHQMNELLFKMILWELEQIAENESIIAVVFAEKLERISRYFDLLTSSFTIMKDGMDVEQYQKFRHTLAPASGFQSAQYRMIEFASTDLINLIDYRFRATIDRNTPYEHALSHLYWQAAGKDYTTGEKSYLLKAFEKKYQNYFLEGMKKYNTTNLWQKYISLPEEEKNNPALISALRHYDKTVNVTWVMGHYHAAKKYIESGQNKQATGGSDWKKYLLPQYQRRIFFPELWTSNELENWGQL